MSVDWRLRRRWLDQQARFAPEAADFALDVLQKFGRRADETEEEFKARLARASEEWMRRSDEEEARWMASGDGPSTS